MFAVYLVGQYALIDCLIVLVTVAIHLPSFPF